MLCPAESTVFRTFPAKRSSNLPYLNRAMYIFQLSEREQIFIWDQLSNHDVSKIKLKEWMIPFRPRELLTEMVAGNWHRVKQLTSRTGRLYANTTIKSMRNRLLLICWKPQLYPIWMAHWRHMGVKAAAVAQRKKERQQICTAGHCCAVRHIQTDVGTCATLSTLWGECLASCGGDLGPNVY